MIIRIEGGLGNQMFYYAFGRALECAGQKVIFDLSFYHGQKARGDSNRSYKLDAFNLGTSMPFSTQRIWSAWLWQKFKRLFNIAPNNYQSESYFSSISELIRQELTLKNDFSSTAKDIAKKIKATDSQAVSLHVRRGDYVSDHKTNAYHGVCGVEYYERAMQRIKDDITNPVYFIFSDDIEWVRNHIQPERTVYVSNPKITDAEEIMLMSLCSHHIIANSTFSWWGAWLGKNTSKLVIAPKNWFTSPKSGDNIVPQSWIRL